MQPAVEPLPRPLAEKMAANDVCSDCWGRLALIHTDDGCLLFCANCGTPRGVVSYKWTIRKREESFAEKANFWRALREAQQYDNPAAIEAVNNINPWKVRQNKMDKQTISFPEVGVIRKGSPKNTAKNAPGKDLGRAMRIVFAPGTEEERTKFLTAYKDSAKVVKYGEGYAEPEGIHIERIRCMFLTRDAAASFQWANEAYQAGRRVAMADDDHFIMQKSPSTGEYIIQDGEPYTPFKRGMEIEYMGKNGKVTLPIKTHGRLALFLPDLGELVQFTLKTTGFFDRVGIQQQLAGIQFLADTLNKGNAAGIPFWVYRTEHLRNWTKPDGSTQQKKNWEITIKADQAWVKNATTRLGVLALGDTTLPALPDTIQSPTNPFDAEDEEPAEAPGEFIDATSKPAPEEVKGFVPELDKKFRYNELPLVQYVADKMKITRGDVLNALYEKFKAKEISEQITINEAIKEMGG